MRTASQYPSSFLPSLDLLTLLRQRTRDRHARLDAGIDFATGTLTAPRYAAFLRGILAVVSPLEPAIERWLGPAPPPARTRALASDLARLGAPLETKPVAVLLPRSVAEAYGCAYVLEGSALGGLVLARAADALTENPLPTSYLRLRGEATARTWNAWLERLGAFGAEATPGDARAACDAACATFTAYEAALSMTGAFSETAA